MKNILFCLLLTTPLISNAKGGEGTGGGDAVTSDSGWTLLDLAEKMETNYIAPLSHMGQKQHLEGPLNLARRCGVSIPIEAPRTVRLQFNLRDILSQIGIGGLNQGLSEWGLYAFAYNNIQQLVWVGTEKPLEEVPDEGVIREIDPKTKKQVAIQKNGVVMVNMPIFRNMDDRNRAALIVHEALLRLILSKFPQQYVKYGTSNIRKTVSLLFNPVTPTIPLTEIQKVCGPQSELWK